MAPRRGARDVQGDADSDTALMRAVAAGDRGAVADLYDRHASAVFGMAMSLLQDAGSAQDVSQEAFVHLWMRAHTFDPARGTARSWLLSITRNLALDELRAQRRRAARVDRVGHEAGNQPDTHGQALLHWGWESEQVLQAVSGLSALQRETVELVYLQGFTLSEVATRLNVAVGTVKSRLHSALLGLRAALADRSPAPGSAAEVGGA
jgi:RNA polymerase sigma-70 factor, ECF subfamily